MLTRKVKLTKDGITMEIPFSMESEIKRFKNLGYYEDGEQPLYMTQDEIRALHDELNKLKTENQKLTKQVENFKKKEL